MFVFLQATSGQMYLTVGWEGFNFGQRVWYKNGHVVPILRDGW